MKNYYEMLEIDKNASDEIIKVAYKALVKKYHPDLKEGASKINAEEKIKQINEAYDILSNPEKKSEYDQNMINEDISKEQYEMLLNENINLKKELFYFKNLNKNSNSFNSNYYNQNNSNIYHNNTQNYNINNNIERKMFKEIVNTFISIIITLFIIIIVYHIPFVKQYVKSIFNNNFIFIIIIVFFSYLYFFRNRK